MIENFNQKKEWFREWFNSSYYHILYKDRNYAEAEKFIDNLIILLNPNKNATFLDVACGKGRHSLFINKQGYKVDGFDLSKNSIEAAKEFENEKLHFFVNDIRKPLKKAHYNYAFNLFTSFGYFDEEIDNQKAVNAISDSLKPNGVLVLDFMNCNKIIKNLKSTESKTIDNITFKISKKVINGFITKQINFNANGNDYSFQEKVKVISHNTFKSYFDKAKLKIESTFGDYNLNPFDLENSDRLILIAKKI